MTYTKKELNEYLKVECERNRKLEQQNQKQMIALLDWYDQNKAGDSNEEIVDNFLKQTQQKNVIIQKV